MTHEFRRTGELKELTSYPAWLQRVVADTRREEIDRVRRAIRTSYVSMEMALDHAVTATLHGSFDETASNASTLGGEDLVAA